VTHSTAGEDDAIAAYFDSIPIVKGRFLDIGAANGITLSNTHRLALAGWTGVCVDANAQELFNLNNLYWNNPNIEIVQGFIGASHGLKDFWNAKEANISTGSKRMQERGRERTGARHCYIAGFTLDDIWKQFGTDFHFVSIDLEDGSLDIMRNLHPELLKVVRIVCVEKLPPEAFFGENESGHIQEWGKVNGFRVLLETGENVVLVK
jgi:FkbM family methyltransferase